jgi:hypothetical protein
MYGIVAAMVSRVASHGGGETGIAWARVASLPRQLRGLISNNNPMGVDMKMRIVGASCLALALAVMAMSSACASMQAAGNPTTQALAQTSAVTGAVAATVAAAAPAPWGQILAGVLGAISVIAGIVAHSTISKNSAQQVVSAVNTGLQAASQTLSSVPAAASVVLK